MPFTADSNNRVPLSVDDMKQTAEARESRNAKLGAHLANNRTPIRKIMLIKLQEGDGFWKLYPGVVQ